MEEEEEEKIGCWVEVDEWGDQKRKRREVEARVVTGTEEKKRGMICGASVCQRGKMEGGGTRGHVGGETG